MENLIINIKILISSLKLLHENLLVASVKNTSLRGTVSEVNNMKQTVQDILVGLKNLEATNPNLFICYDNDVFLSVIEGKYIISNKKNNEVKILTKEKSLQKALRKFYFYAYKQKIKKNCDN